MDRLTGDPRRAQSLLAERGVCDGTGALAAGFLAEVEGGGPCGLGRPGACRVCSLSRACMSRGKSSAEFGELWRAAMVLYGGDSEEFRLETELHAPIAAIIFPSPIVG